MAEICERSGQFNFLNCNESGNEIRDTAKAIEKYYTVIENNKFR